MSLFDTRPRILIDVYWKLLRYAQAGKALQDFSVYVSRCVESAKALGRAELDSQRLSGPWSVTSQTVPAQTASLKNRDRQKIELFGKSA